MSEKPPFTLTAYSRLKAREQRVVDALAKGLTQKDAGIEAGIKPGSASSTVQRMLKKKVVRDALRERRAQLSLESSYDRHVMMADLAAARDLALATKQPAAAVAAIREMGRLAGLVEEKPEPAANVTINLGALTELTTLYGQSPKLGRATGRTLPGSKAILIDHEEWARNQNGDLDQSRPKPDSNDANPTDEE